MENWMKLSALMLTIASTTAFAICPEWTSKKTGKLDKTVIKEASGLVASKVKPGKFIWSNDSGGAAALFGTDKDGRVIKTTQLSNFSNTDFEAIASGPCPSNQGETCLYVGDIGDGIGWRNKFKIGVFKESSFWNSTSIRADKIIEFSYPSGTNNAEALIVTPEGQILVFTKTEGSTQVFDIGLNGKATRLSQFDLKGIIPRTKDKEARITDASISPDGDKVLILTYGDILEINLEAFVAGNPRSWKKSVDYHLIKGPELPQQETIEYDSENSFIVSSESVNGEVPEILTYTCRGF
jgi:hypothetical protein